MVCSCAMSSNFVSLPIIILYICVNETTLFSFLQSLLVVAGRSVRLPKIFLKLGDQMIKQLLNSVIAKYLDLLISVCYSTSVIAGLFDGELALQSAIQKTQKLSRQILSFKLLYCIFFFFVITRFLYLTVKQLSLPDLSSI